jgi:hypothetical protein
MDPRAVTLAIVLLLGLTLIVSVRRLFTREPRITRHFARVFWCPFKQRNVTVDFQEEAWQNRRNTVETCSAFEPPTAVTCARQCLGDDRLEAPRETSA